MGSSEDLQIGMEQLSVSIYSKIMAGFPNENEGTDFNNDRLMMDSGAESPSTLDTVRFDESVSLYTDGTVTTTRESANIIICSDEAMVEARTFQRRHRNQHGIFSVHVCKAEITDLLDVSNHRTVYKEMWIIVDSEICNLFLRKRSFHTPVEDFFENFAEQSKVILINRLPSSEESRFQCFRWQLPEECVREYIEVDISTSLLSEEEIVTTREGSQYDDPRSQAAEDSDAESEYGAQVAEAPADGNNFIQIGSKCQMYSENLTQKWTVMKQDGTQNTMVLQIVPGASTTGVIVNVTTDPRDQGLEERLEYEISQDIEVINVNLKNARIVRVQRGSVIIEIEVQLGQDIGSVWLQHMVESIFTEKVRACVPIGKGLKLDIESNVIVPLADLGRYLSENEEEFHKNCVSKEKYERKVREVEELKRELNPVATVVTFVSGDITQEKTDAIVNSTNVILKLNEGDISKCILEAAGPAIQEECTAKYPNGLEKGKVARTGGGNLACRNIYHVFLPSTWETDQKNTEECLKDAVEQILHQADSDGHKTISFPPLGTGTLHYDRRRVADIMSEVCSGFRGRSLQEARLVHPDGFDTKTYSTEEPQQQPLCEKPESPLETKSSMLSASAKGYERPRTRISLGVGDIMKEEYERKVREVEELKRELNPVATVVTFVSGDITQEKTDAIVNSSNVILKLNEGDISKCILEAAGPAIQEECTAKYPNGLEKGKVARTGGGNLACRNIYHVFLPSTWETDQKNTEECLKDAVEQILHQADSDGHKTISFPPLGTGTLHYDRRRVADIMSEVCSGFRGRSLQEARLVHPDGFDTKTYSTEEPQQQPLCEKPESPLKTKSSTISASAKGYERPRTRISLGVGDIMKEEVDVVVFGVPRDLNLSIGGLSKALLAEAGAEIQQELEDNYPCGISEGRIAITSGGKKSWKQIFFTTLWPWEETEFLRESFIAMILRCLEQANTCQLATIAFPMLGTSGHSYPPDKVTQWILQAVELHDETDTSTTLTEIRILVHPLDHTSLHVLQSMNMPGQS